MLALLLIFILSSPQQQVHIDKLLGPRESRCLQAIEADPKDADLYVGRAATHLKLEQIIEAANDANKAVDLDPRNSRAYLRKG